MLDILLCVLMNVGIFICFRLYGVLKIDTFQAIVFNYFTCVVTGIIFMGDTSVLEETTLNTPWVMIAMVLGGIFIGTFYLMAVTTQKFSMTVSSIASKMSLIIPVLVSLIWLGIQSKTYSWLNYAGMALALIAIFLSSWKGRKIQTHELSTWDLFLPLLVFIFGGVIDSSINYTNYNYLTEREEPVFPLFIFASAAVIGTILIAAKRRRLTLKSLLGGVVLGAINYFSIYFLLTALSAFGNDGAIVYPLINVGIIIVAAGLSVVFFKEKLSRMNQVGIGLAVLAIVFISYQELMALL